MTNTNETRNVFEVVQTRAHATMESLTADLVAIEKTCAAETETRKGMTELINARRLAGIMQVAALIVRAPKWNKSDANKLRELLRTNGFGVGVVKRYTEVPGKLVKKRKELVERIKAHDNLDPVRAGLDWCEENGIKSQADIIRIVEPKKAKSKAEAVADLMEKQDWTAEDHAELATILKARKDALANAASRTEKVKKAADMQRAAKREKSVEQTIKGENIAA
jgi:hypothetical protein